jgi:hypothetical protein
VESAWRSLTTEALPLPGLSLLLCKMKQQS